MGHGDFHDAVERPDDGDGDHGCAHKACRERRLDVHVVRLISRRPIGPDDERGKRFHLRGPTNKPAPPADRTLPDERRHRMPDDGTPAHVGAAPESIRNHVAAEERCDRGENTDACEHADDT